MTQQFKRWDQYVEEARHEPFQLPLSEEETITIEAPSGAQLIQWARAYRSQDAEAMLIVICGEQWPRIEQLLAQVRGADAPAGADAPPPPPGDEGRDD